MDYHFSILISLVVLSGISNAVMDVFKFRYRSSVFKNLDNEFFWRDSWKNKYKNRDPNNGEAFWGSSRWFVFLTNIWHFAQMIWRVSLTSAVAISASYVIVITSHVFVDIVLMVIILSIAYLIPFSVFYNNLLLNDG